MCTRKTRESIRGTKEEEVIARIHSTRRRTRIFTRLPRITHHLDYTHQVTRLPIIYGDAPSQTEVSEQRASDRYVTGSDRIRLYKDVVCTGLITISIQAQ